MKTTRKNRNLTNKEKRKKKERKLFKKMQKKIPFSTHTNVNRNPDLSWNGSSGSFMKTRKKRTFFFFVQVYFLPRDKTKLSLLKE